MMVTNSKIVPNDMQPGISIESPSAQKSSQWATPNKWSRQSPHMGARFNEQQSEIGFKGKAQQPMGLTVSQRPMTADYGQHNVEMGRPFLQEFRDNAVTGEIRCVAWHPTELWLAAAGGWETEPSVDMNMNDQLEKAYVMIWDLNGTASAEDDVLEEEVEDISDFASLSNELEEEKDAFASNSNDGKEDGNDEDVEFFHEGNGHTSTDGIQPSARTKGHLLQKYEGKSAWNSVAWSPAGDKLALCAEKPDEAPASVFLWSSDDIASGRPSSPEVLHDLHNGDVRVVAFCKGGGRLASAAWDNSVIIYWLDSDQDNPQVMIKNFSYGIYSISWAPDLWPVSHKQDILAIGSEDLEIILWQIPKNFSDKDEFSGNGGVTTSDESPRDCLLLTDQITGKNLGDPQRAYENWQKFAHGSKNRVLIPGHEGSVTHVAWHPKHPIIATGSWDNSVAVWDVSSIYEGHSDCLFLDGHKRNVNCVGWNCQGDLLASASDDGMIVIWVVETATKLQVLEGHQGPVLYIQWHPNKPFTLASGSKDEYTQTIVWNHKAMEKPIELPTEAAMCLSRRTNIVGVDLSKSISFGDLSARTMKLCNVRWSPSGRKIAFATHEDIFLWDMATTSKEVTPSDMAEKAACKIAAIAWVQYMKKDFMAVAKQQLDDREWHVEIWDTHKFSCVKDFNVSPIPAKYGANGELVEQGRHGHQHEIRDIAFTKDRELFATGGNDEDIFIWSYSSSKLVKVMTQHSDWVRCLTWCPHKTETAWWLASASDDSSVIVWGIKEVQPQNDSSCREKTYSLFSAMKLVGHRGAVYSVTWGPHAQVASGSFDKTIAIWDLKKLKMREDDNLRQQGSHCCWKVAFAQRDVPQPGIRYLDGHKQEVYDLDWSRDGKIISSCSEDNTIIIWDAIAGKLQQVIPSDSNSGAPVRSVFWNMHCKSPRLVTATLDNQIRVHCILKIPSLSSQKKAAEHLANTRHGRQVLAELVRGDFLSLGTKQGGETLAYFLLKALATSEGKEKASYARAVDVILKSAMEEGDFFYNCKDPGPETKAIPTGSKGRLANHLKGIRRSPQVSRRGSESSTSAPTSILAMAIRSSDVYVIKAVLEFVKAGLCMRRNGKRISLMQAMARENLHKDMVLLLQKFPDQADEFLNSIGLLLAPISVLEDSQNVELGRKSRLLLATKHLCEAGLWQRNWKTCFKNQQGVFSWVFDLKGHMHRLHSLVPTDPEDLFLKPHKQALITGFPNCMSREFLQAVMKSPKQETLFHVPMIRLIYEYKWDKLKATFQIRFSIYCIYLLLLSIYMLKMQFGDQDYNSLTEWVIIFNSYFALSEFAQICLGFKAYMKCVWNYVDLASTVLTFVFFLNLHEYLNQDSVALRTMGAVLSLLAWIKLLHFMLASRYLAALVQSILVICKDIISFLIILAVFFMGFGIAFNVLEVFERRTFDYTLLYNFLMILGDFALEDFEEAVQGQLAVVLFVMFQIIVFIVLLNALIAIMGDSFEKAQQDSLNNFHVQRAQIVEELDQELRMWKWLISKCLRIHFKEKNEVYLHALVTKGSRYSLTAEKSAKRAADEWQGRNAKITGHIDDRMEGMGDMIDQRITELRKLLVGSRKLSAYEYESLKRRMDQLELLITNKHGKNQEKA
mmetsp:Transcript_26717/g.34437  ORF Transcript_26717/g.34437 Transcript_26717/m.34437 type:complete len:1635 (+) Transcript_26717:240-5144(+)